MVNPNLSTPSQDQSHEEAKPKLNKNDFTIFTNDISSEFKDGMQEFYVLGNSIKVWFANIGNWFANLSSRKKQLNFSKKTLNKTEKVEKKLKKIEEQLLKTMELTKEIKADTSKIVLDIDLLIQILDYQMERVEDIEEYMKDNLGSDWLKIKNNWKEYQDGDISRGEFTKLALKKLGKSFLGIFVNTVS